MAEHALNGTRSDWTVIGRIERGSTSVGVCNGSCLWCIWLPLHQVLLLRRRQFCPVIGVINCYNLVIRATIEVVKLHVIDIKLVRVGALLQSKILTTIFTHESLQQWTTVSWVLTWHNARLLLLGPPVELSLLLESYMTACRAVFNWIVVISLVKLIDFPS